MSVTDDERMQLFDYDRSTPLDAETLAVDERDGLRRERFVFRGAAGETVPGVLVRRTDRRGDRPTLVVQHGLNSGKDDPRMADLRDAWARLDFTCITVDAPAHGERAPGPLDIAALLDQPGAGLSFVRQTVVDLRRLTDYLETRDDVHPDRVGYVGFSMSTFLGVQFVAVEQRMRAACFAMGGAGLFHALVARAPAATRAEHERVANLIDPLHFAAHIAPRPVLQVNGAADEVAPLPLAYMLHGALREPKKVIWYPGGHGELPDDALDAMRRFLEHALARGN